jgi:TRAP-type C4-dicarboxylate transport system permease small subunit
MSAKGRRPAPRASRLILDNFEELVATAILVALVVIMSFSVTSRYLLNSPLRWSNELGGLLMVWLIFLGSVGAFKRAEHISVGVLVDRLPDSLQTAIRWFGFLVVEAVLAVLLVKGYALARETGRSALSVPIPWAYVYGAVPVFAVLVTVRLVQQMFFGHRFHFIAGSTNEVPDVIKEASP